MVTLQFYVALWTVLADIFLFRLEPGKFWFGRGNFSLHLRMLVRQLKGAEPSSGSAPILHAWVVNIFSKSFLGTAPTIRSTISPFLNNRIVGMLMIP